MIQKYRIFKWFLKDMFKYFDNELSNRELMSF